MKSRENTHKCSDAAKIFPANMGTKPIASGVTTIRRFAFSRRAEGFVGICGVYSRLSARIAANDVTGLTDSLRGGLHIERVGRQQSLLYTQSPNTRAHSNERMRGER